MMPDSTATKGSVIFAVTGLLWGMLIVVASDSPPSQPGGSMLIAGIAVVSGLLGAVACNWIVDFLEQSRML